MFGTTDFWANQAYKVTPLKEKRLEKIIDTIGKCINAALPVAETAVNVCASRHRRTDEELSRDTTGTDKAAVEFQHCKGVALASALNTAQRQPGVYILYLDGVPMKCGRASYDGGIAWRFRQYYNLNYDDRARRGDCWSVTKQNRDRITVAWQCCPASKCHELEYKLFKKYGKGAWAQRAPASCDTNDWDLLI